MSAMARISDSTRTSRHFAFGPFPDQVQRKQNGRYSITSSAPPSSVNLKIAKALGSAQLYSPALQKSA